MKKLIITLFISSLMIACNSNHTTQSDNSSDQLCYEILPATLATHQYRISRNSTPLFYDQSGRSYEFSGTNSFVSTDSQRVTVTCDRLHAIDQLYSILNPNVSNNEFYAQHFPNYESIRCIDGRDCSSNSNDLIYHAGFVLNGVIHKSGKYSKEDLIAAGIIAAIAYQIFK